MKIRTHRINALFNLAGGASAGCMVLFLPYLLNRVLSQADYAIWVLGFQVAIYVPMFGLGIQQLLNRAIAHHLARDEHEHLHRNLASSLFILIVLAGAALLFVFVSAPFVTRITDAQGASNLMIERVWLKVGGAASLGLFSLFFFGCFGGQQRYEWENIYKAIISVGFIALIICTLGFGLTITPTLLANLYIVSIGCGLLFLIWRYAMQRELPVLRLRDWHMPTVKSYLRGMYGLSVWQIGVLMFSGLDLWIVAKIDFAAVPGYAIALSFLAFVNGAVAALAGPCLPRFAAELSKSECGIFKSIFIPFQSRVLLLLSGLFACIILCPSALWTFLLRESAPSFNLVFPILLLATCLRLVTLLYSLAVIAANVQHRIILSPLVEGVVNLTSSVILAYWFGAIGVAIGTLLGAIACVLFTALHNMRRTAEEVPLTALNMLNPWKI